MDRRSWRRSTVCGPSYGINDRGTGNRNAPVPGPPPGAGPGGPGPRKSELRGAACGLCWSFRQPRRADAAAAREQGPLQGCRGRDPEMPQDRDRLVRTVSGTWILNGTTAGESAGRNAAELAEAAGSTGRCECTVGMNASTTATPRPAATTRRMEMELRSEERRVGKE